MQKQGLKVSDAVGEAMKAVEDSELMKGVSTNIHDVSIPF
jgi:hypothetical protein